jgi:orotate phosphoribosyltransferase
MVIPTTLMAQTSPTLFLDLVSGRRGHFLLESGHHSALWFDLDALFADLQKTKPLIEALTDRLRPYAVSAVCGPLLGGSFLALQIAQLLNVDFCFTERVMPENEEGLYRAGYRLPAAFRPRVAGRKVAIVDDVMSAGSALRGTYAELQSHGAEPVVAAAMLLLGTAGAKFFEQAGVPVEAAERESYDLWEPAQCPLCAAGVAIEDVAMDV